MFDLRKALCFPYLNIKFFLIILIFAILGALGDIGLIIMLILIPIIGTGLLGSKIINKLKDYNPKTITKILKFSGIFLLISIIFFIFEGIIVLIGLLPTFLITKTQFSLDTSMAEVTVSSIILIIFVIAAIILEITKYIGMIRYFKKEKLELFFDFKNNLKIILSKSFLVTLLFMIGYIIMYLILGAIVLGILSAFGLYGVVSYIGSFLLLLVLFLVFGGIYSSFSEVLNLKK